MILDANGKPFVHKTKQRYIKASYDSAQTNNENSLHWANADALSADAAASKSVRDTLRKRSRYEVANNSYARGMVNTIANDAVGATVRLQMFTDLMLGGIRKESIVLNKNEATFIEGEFFAWAQAAGAFEHIRTLRAARCYDGEGFCLLTNNPKLPVPVKLAMAPQEADLVTSERFFEANDKTHNDGIHYDRYGNAIIYELLDTSPGSFAVGIKTRKIKAANMLHHFLAERPGQRRGIPQITAALALFAQLRRWTLAVIAAAETAADLAAIMKTPGEPGENDEYATPFETVPIERRVIMNLPEGYDITQFRAEQPQSTYKEVKREIIGEIARCLEIPVHLALGDSSEHNYSSARLDNQSYVKARRVDRSRITMDLMDPLFKAWVDEAMLIEDYLPQRLRNVKTDWSHLWIYDGDEHVDPIKEANAQRVRLESNTTTLSDEWGAKGFDWEEKLEQKARENKKMEELGLSFGDVTAAPDPENTPEANASYKLIHDDNGNLTDIKAGGEGNA